MRRSLQIEKPETATRRDASWSSIFLSTVLFGYQEVQTSEDFGDKDAI